MVTRPCWCSWSTGPRRRCQTKTCSAATRACAIRVRWLVMLQFVKMVDARKAKAQPRALPTAHPDHRRAPYQRLEWSGRWSLFRLHRGTWVTAEPERIFGSAQRCALAEVSELVDRAALPGPLRRCL